jgi:putative hydrolase
VSVAPRRTQTARQERAVATLRRVAFLLERAQATAYRSEAFRDASRTLEALEPGVLADLVDAGRLQTLAGVGPRVAEVAQQSWDGEAVGYLDRLEGAAVVPDGPGGPLRAALRGDLHAHTEASDGGSSLQEMVLAAMELGHDYLAITDHSPRLTIANGLTAQRLRAQVKEIKSLDAVISPFRALSGIEVDILEDGGLDQDRALLSELDVVVASVHSKLRMDAQAMTRRLLAAVADPNVDVLGHCTGRQLTGRRRPPSEFDHEAVFAACAENGVAVEINSRPDRLDPPHRLLQAAIDAGCVFSIDSDAHAPGQLDWLRAGCDRAAEHGLDPDRVIGTWTVDRLLRWTEA